MYRQEYMDLAIKEAHKAFDKDEVPVGCLIVKDNKVLAKAHNNKEHKQDPTSHAEIECIKKVCKKLNNWHLDECDMYVTLEPCLMCGGAIIQSRIKNIYYCAKDNKGGSLGSNIDIKKIKNINHYPNYEYKEDKDYIELLKNFFKSKR